MCVYIYVIYFKELAHAAVVLTSLKSVGQARSLEI